MYLYIVKQCFLFFLFKNMTSLAQQKAYAFQQAILLFFSNITTT